MKTYSPQYARKLKTSLSFILASTVITVTNGGYASSEDDTEKVQLTFRNGDIHTRLLSNSNGIAMAEGDMIFGNAENFIDADMHRRTRGLSNFSYGRTWPNGLVPYQIQSDVSSATQERIREAVAHWNSFQAISLVERTSSNASAFPDYIDFVRDNRCASWIGYQGNGSQQIYAGDSCSFGTMIHEVGHALGLLHEHTRSDRDQYIKVNLHNTDPKWYRNFEIMDGNVSLGSYDYGSIMHYGEHFFSENGEPTIETLLPTSVKIGQRKTTSEGDRAAVAELYKSDISLVASSAMTAAAGSVMEVSFIVTNNTSVGSNNLSIDLSVPADSQLLSYQSASWMCAQQSTGNTIICTAPVLAASADSKVTINMTTPQTPGSISLDAQLNSRTLDTNPTDNEDSIIATIVTTDIQTSAQISDVPQIAAANAAGSGATDLKTLWFTTITLWLSLCCRRRSDQVAAHG